MMLLLIEEGPVHAVLNTCIRINQITKGVELDKIFKLFKDVIRQRNDLDLMF